MTELQAEVARLKEKVEYERQPSIVFETENHGLQQNVCTVISVYCSYLLSFKNNNAQHQVGDERGLK